MTQYEELALLGLAREQLFYHLIKANRSISMPTNLIRSINAQVFSLELGVFTTLQNKDGKLRGCVGTLETGNDEFNIESNVKKYVIWMH
jgi:AMMECR1 domain-containing protein